MDRDEWRGALEEALARCGIEIERRNLADEELTIKSGLIEMEGRRVLIIDKRLPPNAQMEVMARTLKDEPLENVYLSPALRRHLGLEPE